VSFTSWWAITVGMVPPSVVAERERSIRRASYALVPHARKGDARDALPSGQTSYRGDLDQMERP
jgi:hypothetical protein